MDLKNLLSKKVLSGAVVVLVAVAGFSLWQVQQNNEPAQQNDAVSESSNTNNVETISYSGVDGKTAMELLMQNAEVETKDSSLGEYVVGINGNDGNGEKYWTFYIDGKESMEGAGTYVTKNGQTIEWKLQ